MSIKSRLKKLEMICAMPRLEEYRAVISFVEADGSPCEAMTATSTGDVKFHISRNQGESFQDFRARALSAFAERHADCSIGTSVSFLLFLPGE